VKVLIAMAGKVIVTAAWTILRPPEYNAHGCTVTDVALAHETLHGPETPLVEVDSKSPGTVPESGTTPNSIMPKPAVVATSSQEPLMQPRMALVVVLKYMAPWFADVVQLAASVKVETEFSCNKCCVVLLVVFEPTSTTGALATPNTTLPVPPLSMLSAWPAAELTDAADAALKARAELENVLPLYVLLLVIPTVVAAPAELT
jgi:hypothetical protein